MSERLEEARKLIHKTIIILNSQNLIESADVDNYYWLIEQAERVEQLERKNHLYKLRKENAQDLNEVVIEPLKQENERLKKSLEEIQNIIETVPYREYTANQTRYKLLDLAKQK